MDKILTFLREAKWFSISIGIFMVIWLGPKLLDKIGEIQAEAKRQALIEQQEIARQEQIKKDAIEREERLARLEIEKEVRRKQAIIEEREKQKRLTAERVAREKRLAAEKVEREKREAAEKVENEIQKERQRKETLRLAELEVGLYCRSSEEYKAYKWNISSSAITEIILLRTSDNNYTGAISIEENGFTGSSETIKKFYKTSDRDFNVSPVNFSIRVSTKLLGYTSSPGGFISRLGNISIDRTTLNYVFKSSIGEFRGTCYRRNAGLMRQQVQAHNLKNKTNNQL